MAAAHQDKQEIIRWLKGLEDKEAIEAIKLIKHSFEHREALSAEEKAILDEGLRSFAKGDFVNEDEVWYRINQRYKK